MITFPITLTPARKNSVSRIKLNVSNENVENVVNPPQKPTPISSRSEGFSNPFSSKPNISIPRIMLPSTFTASVPYGKKAGRISTYD